MNLVLNFIKFDSKTLAVSIKSLLYMALDFPICKPNIISSFFMELFGYLLCFVEFLFHRRCVVIECLKFGIQIIICSLDFFSNVFKHGFGLIKVLRIVTLLSNKPTFISILV